jgi:plasmid stabilization system protein ParE
MRYEVVVQPVAEAELEECYRYIWKDAPKRAARWRKEVLGKVESLSRWPKRCPLAPESGALGYEIRHLVVGAYRLFFTIDHQARRVHVLHVRHGARRHLGEEE